MNPVINPYRPGAGRQPMILAGREKVIRKADILLKQVKYGTSPRPIMLYGLRGVGKTVLLKLFFEMAGQEQYLVQHHEMSEKDDFKSVITLAFKKTLMEIDRVERAKNLLQRAFRVLKSITLTLPEVGDVSLDLENLAGWGDSGNFESDLVDLVESVGKAAREYNRHICILIDETQYVDEKSLSALIAACHRVSQDNLPIVFICAGLPQILALTGDAKSYSERLFEFVKINGLSQEESAEAIQAPARQHEVFFDADAVDKLFRLTGGYPYFIQEYCKYVWDVAPSSPITQEHVQMAVPEATESLDQSFFRIRLDRATEAERHLMRTMAEIGDSSFKWNDIISRSGKKPKSLGPIRSSLIKKGFLYAPSYGVLDFTVPKFAEFLRRHYGMQ